MDVLVPLADSGFPHNTADSYVPCLQSQYSVKATTSSFMPATSYDSFQGGVQVIVCGKLEGSPTFCPK